MAVENLITEHLDIRTSAIKTKSAAGRGSSKKLELVGIKKLRELILELAVRGKLVQQDPNDEPASELLKKIEAEKVRLVKEGKIRKQKQLPQIDVEDKPFQKPVGWSFTRLGELFLSINSGGTPSKRNSEYWGGSLPWASVKDLGTQRCIEETQDHITDEGLKNGSRLANIDDILICTRMGLGKISIVKSPMAYNQDLKAVKLTNNVSVEHFINTYATLKIKGTGTTVMGIKQEQLLEYIIGLPPFEEQHRIVAKVDELMALCDQLEAQTESSIDAHKTLVEVLLATLTDAKDADELNDNWQTISQHFDVLFTTQASIDQLKQTILQLAVMGKLVKQDPNDEPASKLLERIATEKQQLIKDGKIKKQKALPPITDEEKPFGLPDGWEWVRFSFLSNEIATGPFGSMIHKRDYVENGIPLINPSHMIDSKIVEDIAIAVTDTKAEELSSYILYENDIVMARRGEMGRCALVTARENGWLCGTGSFVLRFNSSLSRNYILLLFKTKWIKEYLGGESIGTTMTNLNHGILNKLPLLIPPIDEQYRIVSQVDKLMALCDSLKERLNQAQTTQLHLTDAIVEQAS
jgi:type I restriction enzyme S subunit